MGRRRRILTVQANFIWRSRRRSWRRRRRRRRRMGRRRILTVQAVQLVSEPLNFSSMAPSHPSPVTVPSSSL